MTLELGRGVGEEPVDRGADEANHALRIGEHDDVSGVLHQRTEVRFTVAQGGGLRFQLLVERVVVPDHDELTDHDESDHDDEVPEQEGVGRTTDILEHGENRGDRHRDVGEHECPATERLIIGLGGRPGRKGRPNSAKRDQEVAGDPAGIDELHLAVGVARGEVGEGAIGKERREEAGRHQQQGKARRPGDPAQQQERHDGDHDVADRIGQAEQHREGRVGAGEVDGAENGGPADQQQRARDDRAVQ